MNKDLILNTLVTKYNDSCKKKTSSNNNKEMMVVDDLILQMMSECNNILSSYHNINSYIYDNIHAKINSIIENMVLYECNFEDNDNINATSQNSNNNNNALINNNLSGDINIMLKKGTMYKELALLFAEQCMYENAICYYNKYITVLYEIYNPSSYIDLLEILVIKYAIGTLLESMSKLYDSLNILIAIYNIQIKYNNNITINIIELTTNYHTNCDESESSNSCNNINYNNNSTNIYISNLYNANINDNESSLIILNKIANILQKLAYIKQAEEIYLKCYQQHTKLVHNNDNNNDSNNNNNNNITNFNYLKNILLFYTHINNKIQIAKYIKIINEKRRKLLTKSDSSGNNNSSSQNSTNTTKIAASTTYQK
jgi:hypothetical protein